MHSTKIGIEVINLGSPRLLIYEHSTLRSDSDVAIHPRCRVAFRHAPPKQDRRHKWSALIKWAPKKL